MQTSKTLSQLFFGQKLSGPAPTKAQSVRGASLDNTGMAKHGEDTSMELWQGFFTVVIDRG